MSDKQIFLQKNFIFKKKINICIISYAVNFLAEGTIRSLNFNEMEVHVIHVCKTQEQIDSFVGGDKHYIYNGIKTSHASILNFILLDVSFRDILLSDIIIMIDHDFYFFEFKKNMSEWFNFIKDKSNWILSAKKSNYSCIVDDYFEKRLFSTSPCFFVNLNSSNILKYSWTPKYENCYLSNGKSIKVSYDTGQFSAFRHENEILLYDFTFEGFHVSSAWSAYWKSWEYRKRMGGLRISIGIKKGYFSPSKNEIKMILKSEKIHRLEKYAIIENLKEADIL